MSGPDVYTSECLIEGCDGQYEWTDWDDGSMIACDKCKMSVGDARKIQRRNERRALLREAFAWLLSAMSMDVPDEEIFEDVDRFLAEREGK